MKVHVPVVYLVVSFAFAATQANASTTTAASAHSSRLYQPALEASRPSPSSFFVKDSAAERHRYPVNDEKGLLLTCIAPEIDANAETDVFNNCALAPGRTLDDVMHSFVRGIHEEQHQHAKESSDSSTSSLPTRP